MRDAALGGGDDGRGFLERGLKLALFARNHVENRDFENHTDLPAPLRPSMRPFVLLPLL